MSMKNKAIERIKNDEISTNMIMCAFDIIGREYLDGEMAYRNTFNDFCNLIADFGLEANEIVDFIVRNSQYNANDSFISFDGQVLTSFSDDKYFKQMIIDKMNGECAEFIMMAIPISKGDE